MPSRLPGLRFPGRNSVRCSRVWPQQSRNFLYDVSPMFHRKRFRLRLRSRTLILGERTLVMGVLNITPDSFSDGGAYLDSGEAVARALQLEQDGADNLDIGGESTRPGATLISPEEELRRILPVI